MSEKQDFVPYQKSNEEKLIADALGRRARIDLPVSIEAAQKRDEVLKYFLDGMHQKYNPGVVLKMSYGVDTAGLTFSTGYIGIEIGDKEPLGDFMVEKSKGIGLQLLGHNTRRRYLKMFLPYEENSLARKDLGLTCPYDVISKISPNFDMIEAIKYFENHVSSSVEPFETMVLELLPLELHNQLTSEFKKILEADSQKDK